VVLGLLFIWANKQQHQPFAPLLGDRVDRSFTWRGHRFPEGRLVLSDVYGTDHHPDAWPGLEPSLRVGLGRLLGGHPRRGRLVQVSVRVGQHLPPELVVVNVGLLSRRRGPGRRPP
jgi:hypothetical protein